MLAMGRYALVFALSMGFIAACTNANKVNRIQRVRANGNANGGTGNGDVNNLPKTGNANLTVTFSDAKFVEMGLNMSSLTYKFIYLGASAQGPIVFTSNNASIALSNLPTNMADDVRLEVYDNNQFQMVGRAPKVTLKAGNNTVQITEFTAENVELNGAWDGKSFQGNAAWKIEGN